MGVLFMAHRHLSFILVKKRRVNSFKRMWLSLTHISLSPSLSIGNKFMEQLENSIHMYSYICTKQKHPAMVGGDNGTMHSHLIYFMQTQFRLCTSEVYGGKKTAVNRMSCFSYEKWWKSLSFCFLSVLLLYTRTPHISLSNSLHEYCCGPFYSLALNHWIIRIIKMTLFRFFFLSSSVCTLVQCTSTCF